jgi:hypothetical protein
MEEFGDMHPLILFSAHGTMQVLLDLANAIFPLNGRGAACEL